MTRPYFLRKREKFFNKKKLAVIEARIATLEKPIKTNWITNCAHLAQIAMLFVVTYGYVFTVIPVFQKEQIAEKLAELEIEKTEWSSNLSNIKKELSIKKNELAKLDEYTKASQKELQKLKIEKEKVVQSLSKSTEELNNAKQQIANANDSLIRAKDDLVKQMESQILGKSIVSKNYLSVIKQYTDFVKFPSGGNEFNLSDSKVLWSTDDKIYTKSFISDFQQVSPYNNLDVIITELAEKIKLTTGLERDALTEIYKKYEYSKDNKQNLLSCPSLPLDEWYSTYVALDELHEDFTQLCVSKTRANLKALGRDPDHEPLIEYYESVCSSRVDRKLSDIMLDKWQKVLSPCSTRVTKLNQIVLNDLNETDLPAFTSLQPPSMELIKTQTRDFVNTNDFFVFK